MLWLDEIVFLKPKIELFFRYCAEIIQLDLALFHFSLFSFVNLSFLLTFMQLLMPLCYRLWFNGLSLTFIGIRVCSCCSLSNPAT